MKSSFKTGIGALLTHAILAVAALSFNPACAAPAASTTTNAALPGNSVYQLPVTLTDQDNRSFELAARRGQPMVISMFYTSCQFVCPMLIETIRATTERLSSDERARLSSMLVSFDPERDSVDVLKSVAAKRGLDSSWTLARTDAASVRKLAAALGIQYRLLADGEFNHSTVLILLDGQGRVVARSNKMGTVDPAFLKLLQKTVKAAN